MKKLKIEFEILNNTIKSLAEIRLEGNSIKKSICDLQVEIEGLMLTNKEILYRIKGLEDGFEEESDDKSENYEDETSSNLQCK